MDIQNSAARIFEIASKASSSQAKGAVELWTGVFRISKAEPHALMMEVSQRLIWLDSELNTLVEFLATERNYPKQGYSIIQTGIRNATAPHLLAHQGDNVRQHLKPEVMASLYQIALNLPDEEELISQEQLTAFEEVLEALSVKLSTPDIGPFLSGVLRRHIRLLRRALDAYPIWGIRAFSDSLRDALGDLFIVEQRQKNGDTVSDADKSVIEDLKSAWQNVSTVVTEVDKLKKLAVLVGQAYTAFYWLDHQIR